MKQRTLAREFALQLLYLKEMRNHEESNVEEFWSQIESEHGSKLNEDIRRFAMSLYRGVKSNAEELDELISKASENWDLNRMGMVDRNLIRIGAFELIHEPDTPPKVVINEAIELAKRFGDAESPKFVNGILDKLYKSHNP